jgi:hypothetical protein
VDQEVAARNVMPDPPTRCSGMLVEFDPGDAMCERGEYCDAFEYRNDYPTYRAAHRDIVSADVVMDPDGEF